MIKNYTAKYTKINFGYMVQLIELPEVITDGENIEECSEMHRDALKGMILASRQQSKENPSGNCLIEQLLL